MVDLPTDKEPVKVVEGDCLELLRSSPAGGAQLIVTSPPYFNAREYAQWPTYESHCEWVREAAKQLVRAVEPGRMVAVVVSAVITPRPSRNGRSARHNLPAVWATALSDAGAWFAEDLVWEKPEGAAINRSQRFSLDRHPMQWRANPNTERVLVYQTPTDELNDDIIARHGGRDRVEGEWERGEVWRIPTAHVPGHSAPYPVEIPARLVRFYSWRGETVLDPFAGSGTTGVAAVMEGRRAILIEKEPAYAEIARKRIAERLDAGLFNE